MKGSARRDARVEYGAPPGTTGGALNIYDDLNLQEFNGMTKKPVPIIEDTEVPESLRVSELEVGLTEAQSAISIRFDGLRVGGGRRTRLTLSFRRLLPGNCLVIFGRS